MKKKKSFFVDQFLPYIEKYFNFKMLVKINWKTFLSLGSTVKHEIKLINLLDKSVIF